MAEIMEGTSMLQTDTEKREARTLSPYAEKYKWQFEAYHPSLQAVLPAVKQFVSDVLNREKPYWLSILGPSGVGKTHILKQAYRMLSRNEHLWPIQRFGAKNELLSEHMPQCAHIIPGMDLDDWKAPKDYGNYDLIYVEDIGAGAGTERGAGAVTISRVAELLQYRTGRWTLLCANKSMAQVAKDLDPRIASRLVRDGSVLIELPADVPDFHIRG